MKRKILIALAVVIFAVVVGVLYFVTHFGPGLEDFSVRIAGDYHIHRTSTEQIIIAPKAWSDSTPTIPTKVIECDADKRFIIAKRQGLKRRSQGNPNDTYEVPDPKIIDYWILDTAAPEVFGPLTLNEFVEKRKKLGVPSALSLKDVYSFQSLQ